MLLIPGPISPDNDKSMEKTEISKSFHVSAAARRIILCDKNGAPTNYVTELNKVAQDISTLYRLYLSFSTQAKGPFFDLVISVKAKKQERNRFFDGVSQSDHDLIFVIGDRGAKKWLEDETWQELRKNKQVIFLHFPLSKNTPEHWRKELSKK